MNPEEIINSLIESNYILQGIYLANGQLISECIYIDAIEEAIKIISKSVDLEPIKSTSIYTNEIVYSCPTCKHTFLTTTWPNYFGVNYCGFCGQAIIFKG